MLPPFIIEQIRRREEEERRRGEGEQPRLDLPLDRYRPGAAPPEREDEAPRGLVILDL